MATSITWPPIGGSSYSVPASGESNWPALSNYLIALANAQSTGSQKIAARIALTTPVTVASATDCLVTCALTVPAAVTVNLPAGVMGQWFAIGDGQSNAATYNITIVPNGAETIAGLSNYILTQDGASVILAFTGSGNWTIIAQAAGEGGGGGVSRSTLDAGNPGWVVINDETTGLMSEEAALAVERGGLGLDATLFSGFLKFNAGVASASAILASEIPVGINANKIFDGSVGNTQFERLSGVTGNIQVQLDGKVDENVAITPGTNTKITYDAKGLVTSATGLSASDIPSSIPAVNIALGSVNDTEFEYLDGVTSPIQAQLTSNSSTGLRYGGILSINANPALFNLSAGSGVITDYTTPSAPVKTVVTWSAFNAQTITNIGSAQLSYIGINSSGAIVQQTTTPTNTERRGTIWVGSLGHVNNTSITSININPDVLADPQNQFRDLANAIGTLNLTGNVISANGANLSFNKTVGTFFSAGSNFSTSIKDPNVYTSAVLTPATFLKITQSAGSGGTVSVIDPANYDLAGVVTAIGGAGSRSTNQRVWLNSNNVITVQYGQNIYTTLANAVAAVGTESYTANPFITNVSCLLGTISVRRDATDLSNTAQAVFTRGSKFGSAAASGSTVSPLTTKGDLYTFSTVDDRLPVGTNGYVLKSDSTQATGLAWGVDGISTSSAVTSAVSPAVSGTMYLCTSTGGFTITLPTIPAGGAIIGVMDAGETCSATNYIRVAPATGQSIDGYAVNDTLSLDYVRANVVIYAAAGATSWKVQYQTTSMIQPGLQSGITTGATIGAGYIGEKITWASAPSDQTFSTIGTTADWTNATITLTAGSWLLVANIAAYCTTGTGLANSSNFTLSITDSGNTIIQNQRKTLYNITPAAAAMTIGSSLAFAATLELSASATYKIRGVINGNTGAVGQAFNSSNGQSEFFAIRKA